MTASQGHEYTVELRVFGPTLNPSQVTSETGLAPCQVRLAGSSKGSRTYTESLWAFNGGSDANTHWNSLEDGLVFVLDRVAHLEDTFTRYSREYSVIWWCGHFQRSFDGGPTLSAPLLGRLARFGADLFIDNYFSDST